MCSIPVWSMTWTAIFTSGGGRSNRTVFVVSSWSQFSESVSRLKMEVGPLLFYTFARSSDSNSACSITFSTHCGVHQNLFHWKDLRSRAFATAL